MRASSCAQFDLSPNRAPSGNVGVPLTYVARAPGENAGVALLDDDTLKAIAEIDYLRDYDDGIYRDLDIELTLNYMRRRFVTPLSRHVDIEHRVSARLRLGFRLARFRLSSRRRQPRRAGRTR